MTEVPVPLLLPWSTTPDGGSEGHADLAPSTRGRRGGPRTGGPETPFPHFPGPAGPRQALRSRRSVGGVRGCLAVLLLVAAAALAGATAEGRAVSRAELPSGVSTLTFPVTLGLFNATTNATTPVPQTLGAVLFLETSDLQPYDDFLFQNGQTYTPSDFPGVYLNNLTSVFVDLYPPPGCNCSGFQAAFEDLNGSPTLSLNAVFLPNATSPSLPPPPPAGPATSPFPLFLQLVGVGVFAALTYAAVVGLRKLLAPLTSGD